MRRLFVLFVLSGFSGLVYQVVWLRLAMAAFGVTTPLVSIVLSVFMAGLALGSFLAGRLATRLEGAPPARFLRLYAGVELWIGLSGIVVAPLLAFGRTVVAGLVETASWGSGSYYAASGAWVVLALLPFCVGMGATFPLAMAAIRGGFPAASPRSFSFLYVANVLGAVAGALVSAFVLIELLGFRDTLLVAATVNGIVALTAFAVAPRLASSTEPRLADLPARVEAAPSGVPLPGVLGMLLTTGLVSLAMEVVWTRQFIPFEGPVVYAFATILAVYLATTVLGSRVYRLRAARGRVSDDVGPVLLLALVAALLPLAFADPRLPIPHGLVWGSLRVFAGIGPFCAVLGYLTPLLMDRSSAGGPGRAGGAYALNTLGCIAGPLIAGFLLLPLLSERATLVVLSVPLLAWALATLVRAGSWLPLLAALAAAALLRRWTRSFEGSHPPALVRRDDTATVIAAGERMTKILLVNGTGITTLTPISKVIAHLPLAHLGRAPRNGLVLCLGMGTSFRAMLSWGIPATVVELVPSVPGLLPFFQVDGAAMLNSSPDAHIVVDDARRFLERS